MESADWKSGLRVFEGMDKKERYQKRAELRYEKIRAIEHEQAKKDENYMRQAMKQAKKAASMSEVPIGCVIVYEDRVIARGYNRRNTDKSSLSHAEIMAIKKACKVLGDWRLEHCTMYVTLEPCAMCAGAIIQARIERVVMACMNPKAGSVGSLVNLFDVKGYNHHPKVTTFVLGDECSMMLKDFFRNLRLSKKRCEVEEQDERIFIGNGSVDSDLRSNGLQ